MLFIFPDVADLVRKVRLFFFAIRKNTHKIVFVILYLDKCIYVLKNQTYFGTAMGEVIEPLFKPGRGKLLTHRENKS